MAMATERDRSTHAFWVRRAPGYALFWSHNLLWASFDLYILWSLAELFVSTHGSEDVGLPLKIGILLGGMCLIPVPAMVAAAGMDREDRPARLVRLLYGIEVPIQGLL